MVSASPLSALIELEWPAYILAFGGSFVVAWLLTPLLVRYAVRRGHLDLPEDEASPPSPVPYFGGLAIVAAFSALSVAAALMAGTGHVLDQLAVLLGVGLVLAIMGLVDDLRGGISPWLRLVIELAAGVVVYTSGSGVDIAGFPDPVNLVLTVVWVVGITNAFNLLDNMDGLSAGIAALAGGTFALIAGLNGQYLVAGLAAGVAGCAVGFLRHNFYPAKIYMGDAGSLFLGFLLAVLGLKLQLTATPQVVALFVPVLVLGLPIFDTTLVVWQRLRHGRSPMQGGRDHSSHRLVWIGLPVPAAVSLLYGAAVSLSWLALLLSSLDASSGLILIGFVMATGLALLIALAVIPVYENSRQRRSMLRLVSAHEVEPEPTASNNGDRASEQSPASRAARSQASAHG